MFAPTFIEHRGVRILRLDYSGLSESGIAEAAAEVRRVVDASPPRSLRILSVLRGTKLTAANADRLKQVALENKPHVRAGAVVGHAFWNVIVTDLQARGRSDMAVFDEEASALEWLAAQ